MLYKIVKLPMICFRAMVWRSPHSNIWWLFIHV